MYEELIKRLRTEANEWCTNCCYKQGSSICTAPDDRKKDCDIYTKLQAADAIEDLEFACNRYEKDYKALCAYLPKWIPVTERLPDKTGKYLVCGQWTGKPAETWVCELIAFGTIKGWANEARNPAVTHWMPLPDPPKGETE